MSFSQQTWSEERCQYDSPGVYWKFWFYKQKVIYELANHITTEKREEVPDIYHP